MTKKTCKIVSAFLSLIFILSLTACGNGGNGGNSGNSEGGNGGGVKEAVSSALNEVKDNLSQAADEIKDAVTGGSPLTIYRVGDDIIAFLISAPECKNLVSSNQYEDSNANFRVYSESEEFHIEGSFQTRGGDVYHHVGSDSGENSNFWSYDDVSNATEDCYFISFMYKDFWKEFNNMDPSVNFHLNYSNWEKNEDKELAVITAGEAIKEVTMEELADIAGAALKLQKPEGKWEGTFITEIGAEHTGKLEGKVTKNNAIFLSFTFDDEKYEFFGLEKPEDYNDSEHKTYNLVLFNAPAWYDGANSGNTNLKYSWTHYQDSPDTWEYIEYEYRDWEKDIDLEAYYEPYTEWFTAPADYVDEDKCGGKILKKDAEDSKYFTPATDDYIISAEYDTTADGRSCDMYRLFSFNQNGLAVDFRVKYVFKSADDAKATYNTYNRPDDTYTTYVLSGNVIYYFYNDTSEIGTSYFKWSQIMSGRDYYKNCHYIYGWQKEDGTYALQTYVSKPYTDSELKMSLEDTLFWQAIPMGTHRSLEHKDVTLRTYLSGYSLEFYPSGQVSEDNWFYSGRELRFLGKKVLSLASDRKWNYELQKSEYLMYFTEMVFEKEVATVTQYTFVVDDIGQEEITFDNFTTKTPKSTIKSTFDMTRVEKSDYYY